jgi:hypothetical protein
MTALSRGVEAPPPKDMFTTEARFVDFTHFNTQFAPEILQKSPCESVGRERWQLDTYTSEMAPVPESLSSRFFFAGRRWRPGIVGRNRHRILKLPSWSEQQSPIGTKCQLSEKVSKALIPVKALLMPMLPLRQPEEAR